MSKEPIERRATMIGRRLIICSILGIVAVCLFAKPVNIERSKESPVKTLWVVDGVVLNDSVFDHSFDQMRSDSAAVLASRALGLIYPTDIDRIVTMDSIQASDYGFVNCKGVVKIETSYRKPLLVIIDGVPYESKETISAGEILGGYDWIRHIIEKEFAGLEEYGVKDIKILKDLQIGCRPQQTPWVVVTTDKTYCRTENNGRQGKSFLSGYPKLTEKTLRGFFRDWKAYSDSVDSNNIIADSVVVDVIMQEYSMSRIGNRRGSDSNPRYSVVPQRIKVERCYSDVDTVMAKLCHGFPEAYDSQYAVDSIIPPLPSGGLYLTSEINETLSNFIGGIMTDDGMAKIDKGNVRKLKKYIPVDYGHWGGYWWFTSFPLITDIGYADNLIAVKRRTSWCSGDVIWYVKEDGKFVRRREPMVSWIE